MYHKHQSDPVERHLTARSTWTTPSGTGGNATTSLPLCRHTLHPHRESILSPSSPPACPLRSFPSKQAIKQARVYIQASCCHASPSGSFIAKPTEARGKQGSLLRPYLVAVAHGRETLCDKERGCLCNWHISEISRWPTTPKGYLCRVHGEH
jgi:hypothetical protein